MNTSLKTAPQTLNTNSALHGPTVKGCVKLTLRPKPNTSRKLCLMRSRPHPDDARFCGNGRLNANVECRALIDKPPLVEGHTNGFLQYLT